MQRQTLAEALNEALTKQLAGQIESPDATDILLAALSRSTTRMDQIVQRRIGQHHTHMNITK